MKHQILGLCIVTLTFASICLADTKPQERSDWAPFFLASNAKGTIVVADERTGSNATGIHNLTRSKKRYSPASTFKIPHSLFALETKVVRDEFQIFPWDGTVRNHAPWNHDHNLRSAIRNSVVWVFQQIARDIGEEKEGQYLRKIGYGNADASGGIDEFWLDGKLKISAQEQIAFLRRLYQNKLPFQIEHQRLVKDIMIVEAGRDWRLRAKTGWDGKIGWWVGWIEWPTGPVFFALNIDTPKRLADLPKREAITRAILRSIKALPVQNNK